MGNANCAICGCQVHRKGDYARPTVIGRSHATRHHYVARRFLKGRDPIFKKCPWLDEQDEFCYECHEELLHNPVFLSEDISRFAELVRRRNLDESKKTANKGKIAKRIELFHEVIEKGIKTLLMVEKRR